MRIADVVFDVPVPHPFSYRVPDDWTLAPGQRVRAPLHGGPRVGLVVAVRDGSDATLKPLGAVVDPAPRTTSAPRDGARWPRGARTSRWARAPRCSPHSPPAVSSH